MQLKQADPGQYRGRDLVASQWVIPPSGRPLSRLAEGELGREDDRGALPEPTDQTDVEPAPRIGEDLRGREGASPGDQRASIFWTLPRGEVLF